MTTTDVIRVSREWLDVREHADAAARSQELVSQLRPRLPAGRLLVHDLGSGSGAMGRWLAPLLPEPQHWILHDRDSDLLTLAETAVPEGTDVTVETRLGDVTQLGRDELVGAGLITVSALLDLLTANELSALVDACAGAACPVLLTLSVNGWVRVDPADPLDAGIAASFDQHQRRLTPRGRLLGPHAVDAAADMFRRLGADVVLRPSAWELGADESELTAQWLAGWVSAACEQQPGLVADAEVYLCRRLEDAARGNLAVTVGHADMLVLP